MNSAFKKLGIIVVYMILGYLLECFCEIIHSDYLVSIYRTPFFAVLITLTVFSFTLFSYIAGKISLLENQLKINLKATRMEIKYAFVELVLCDILCFVLLILFFSDITTNKFWHIAILSALNTLFILVIHILIDLGRSIFMLFEYEGKIRDILRKRNYDQCAE